MMRHGDRCAGDGHVRVADRLDLLETVPVRDLVEPAKELVQGLRELLRRGSSGLSVEPTASTKMTLTSSNASAIRSPEES